MKGTLILSFLFTIATLLTFCFAIPAVDTIPSLTPFVPSYLGPDNNVYDQKTACYQDCKVGFSHDTLTTCGTDGCTYSGPKELVCFQSCGKKVESKRNGNCSELESKKAKGCPRKI
ncbi:uncharacterized protein LOC117170208 [Belonocnema kinseyi]|uniref:uncharacterized protein LOC117170208 n=1 Tax=Belonocnema kinseyi TaxID=2817044 RepID=UPI00143DA76C|nr:uncharacterized protein LOC117170208 [Belonocnema kinseyi]